MQNSAQEKFLTTKDKVKIAINHYESGSDEVLIVAPGWFMTKDSKAFLDISASFFEYLDVISLDFRGHGRSSGFYTFAAKEMQDIETVIEFAKSQYKNVYLMGFSLGAMICLNYVSSQSGIQKVIAVSPPCDFSKIENQMWKKEAWLPTFKKMELKRWFSIRPSIFPHKKIKTIDIIQNNEAETLYIAGKFDPTVHIWHTKALYDKSACKKEFKCFEMGEHAEDLFLGYKEEFMRLSLDWLELKEKIKLK